MSQGTNANYNGKAFIETAYPFFVKNKFAIYSGTAATARPNLTEHDEKYVLTNMPYTTIYGTHGYCGMRIVNKKNGVTVRVCTHYQESSGSADMKLPYLLENIKTQFPEKEIILVIDGSEVRPAVKAWLKKQAKSDEFERESGGKVLLIMSMKGFFRYFNKYLK